MENAKTRCIIDLTSAEAQAFLLKHESYSNTELPRYFQFGELLKEVKDVLGDRHPYCNRKKRQELRETDGVNYRILKNLDGRYRWRPLELIHPALYVSMVNTITKPNNWDQIRQRLCNFRKNPKIKCLSLPVESLTEHKDKAEQIGLWWEEVEQKSIELSLDFEFLTQTDIADCYPGIYTHSIAWALHSKATAKKGKSNEDLLGNIIDNHIMDMTRGQTNGIPQGSVLMDFVAEIVLGYADSILTEELEKQKIREYQILRFRDDYRIFVNSTQDGDRILKCLAEVMIELGLRLNPAKTTASSEVIRSSIKEEKLNWTFRKQVDKTLLKHLLIIHDHGIAHPNAGSLEGAMRDYHKRIYSLKEHSGPTLPLIAIVADVMYRNPRTNAVCAAILSKLVDFLDSECEKQNTVEKVRRKFSNVPNTGYLDIWLQRLSHSFAPDIEYNESLCKLVYQCRFPLIEYDERKRVLRLRNEVPIWNNEWISSDDLREVVDPTKVVDRELLDEIAPVVAPEEVQVWTVYPP